MERDLYTPDPKQSRLPAPECGDGIGEADEDGGRPPSPLLFGCLFPTIVPREPPRGGDGYFESAALNVKESYQP